MRYYNRLQILILGFGLTILSGCFQASTMPLPKLTCPLACVLRVKASSTVTIPVTLTQSGESKDTRQYALSVTPEINNLTLNFIQTKVRFEESAQLQVTIAASIPLGSYEFVIRATAGSDIVSNPLLVVVEQ